MKKLILATAALASLAGAAQAANSINGAYTRDLEQGQYTYNFNGNNWQQPARAQSYYTTKRIDSRVSNALDRRVWRIQLNRVCQLATCYNGKAMGESQDDFTWLWGIQTNDGSWRYAAGNHGSGGAGSSATRDRAIGYADSANAQIDGGTVRTISNANFNVGAGTIANPYNIRYTNLPNVSNHTVPHAKQGEIVRNANGAWYKFLTITPTGFGDFFTSSNYEQSNKDPVWGYATSVHTNPVCSVPGRFYINREQCDGATKPLAYNGPDFTGVFTRSGDIVHLRFYDSNNNVLSASYTADTAVGQSFNNTSIRQAITANGGSIPVGSNVQIIDEDNIYPAIPEHWTRHGYFHTNVTAD